MSQASSIVRRPRRRRLRRLLKSLRRLPLVSLTGLGRWFEPGFWLERRARHAVRRWLPTESRRQLERLDGPLSTGQGQVLAYLSAKAPPAGDMVHIGGSPAQATAWMLAGVRQRNDRPQIISIATGRHDFRQPAAEPIRRIDSQAHRLKIVHTHLEAVEQPLGRSIALICINAATTAESCRLVERFLPAVQAGGWAVCVVPARPAGERIRAAVIRTVARDRRFRRLAAAGELEIFRRES